MAFWQNVGHAAATVYKDSLNTWRFIVDQMRHVL